MRQERIKELIKLLPPADALPGDRRALTRPGFGSRQLEEVMAGVARHQANMQFQYLYAMTFYCTGAKLPGEVRDPWIHRAHRALVRPSRDELLQRALVLLLQHGRATANFIEALILGKAPHEVIARMNGCPVEVIQVYEKLFFDARDRLDEPMFISSYLYPEGDFGFDQFAISPSLRLKRIAWKYGWREALPYMGINVGGRNMAKDNEELMAEVIAQSRMSARAGVIPLPDVYAMAKTWISSKTMATGSSSLGAASVMETARVVGNLLVDDIMGKTRSRLTGDSSATLPLIEKSGENHARENLQSGQAGG